MFLLSADLDSFSLEWIERKITKEDIETVIKGLNEYKEKDPLKKNLNIENVEPVNLKQLHDDWVKNEAIKCIYKGDLF